MQYLVVNILIVFVGFLIVCVFASGGFGKVESLNCFGLLFCRTSAIMELGIYFRILLLLWWTDLLRR